MPKIRIEDCQKDSEGRPMIPAGYTLAPVDEPTKRDVRKTGKGSRAKRKATVTGNRFAELNLFVDVTMRDLTPSERLVWFVLYRDVRNGVATVAQSDVAKRSGLTQATVSLAITRLVKRGLVRVIRQGGFRKGLSTYRIRGSV